MDARLVCWARAVKARRGASGLPVLWLFTDPQRLPDPRQAVAALPRGMCGVVLRQDDAALGRDLARICRARRNALVVAGNWRLAAALGAGVHLRRGIGPGRGRLLTSSAHNRVELRRARRAGAALVFLSPIFSTASHVGVLGLGMTRWAALAMTLARGGDVAALGGIDGLTARRLPRFCAAVGAIGALA
jgi:thiamine-phosphate pyrophosphorylase